MEPAIAKNQGLNYDPLAKQYDQRYRANPLAGVERALVDLAHALNPGRILEVGCGTGHWLKALARHFPLAQICGLDVSLEMLHQAQNKSTPLHLIQGKAGELPLRSTCFDLVFCVNALHHFDHPASFIAQARHLLRPRGQLAVIGQVPHDRRNRWYVYDYFAGTYENDLQRFPDWSTVRNWLEAVGFEQVRWDAVEWISDDKVGRAVLDDPFLQKQATSQLALLSKAAYRAGIEKIELALKEAETQGKTLTFPTQLRLDMFTGRTPKED